MPVQTGSPAEGSGAVVYGGASASQSSISPRTPNWIDVKRDFGAVGNGVADDTAPIQRAIDSAPAQGATIFFPAGQYKISSTINIGGGSSGAISTVGNNLRLVGQGGPTNNAFGDSKAGVALVWAGGAAIMLHINGPISGVGVDGFFFDAASLANTCIRIDHSDRSVYQRIECVAFLTEGIIQSAYPNPTGFANGANGNLFKFIYCTSLSGAVTCFRIGENTIGSAPNLDPASNFYENLALASFGAGGIGVQLRFCDSEMFLSPSLKATIPIDVQVPSGSTGFPANVGFSEGNLLPSIDTITGAVTNAGLIRIQTSAAHGHRTNDWVSVINVGGVPNATGVWKVTNIDATHYDLQLSTFAGGYTSGGTAQGNVVQEILGTWNPIQMANGGLRFECINITNCVNFFPAPYPAIIPVTGTTTGSVQFGPQARDLLFSASTVGTTVNSAASDVTTYSKVLDAGVMNVLGAELRVRCAGVHTSTTAVTWVVKLFINGTAFVSASLAASGAATNLPFTFKGALVTRATGSSGSVVISDEFAAFALATNTIGASGNRVISLDLTKQLTILATINIASGTPANNGTGDAFVLEVVYPRITA